MRAPVVSWIVPRIVPRGFCAARAIGKSARTKMSMRIPLSVARILLGYDIRLTPVLPEVHLAPNREDTFDPQSQERLPGVNSRRNRLRISRRLVKSSPEKTVAR